MSHQFRYVLSSFPCTNNRRVLSIVKCTLLLYMRIPCGRKIGEAFNYNVITSSFIKLPWPGDSKLINLRSSSEATTCLPHGRNFTIFLSIAERKAGKLKIPISIVLGLP